ncbi:SusD-like starch-binding protein associating with outer membrane [Chitinophaga skermanii]|uniref:SusD-like starch-binding protein associating with outer membrane n=1 Tax=Chitinophaga skermanii TaxID=331697 RepID=A0A327R417_9BACT|nr:SusD/RagB family nutrient-binding outer membrane lipoprotein [Chitinophaga skermanii]RAJ10955.1 SusD-like starch-binding protein associating with outer membrane [Chitinophaga skermanii]
MWKSGSIIILLCLLVVTSCKHDFEEINTNPYGFNDVEPKFLLSTAITKTAYELQHVSVLDHPGEAGRYITMVRNETMDKFLWGPQDWRETYARLTTIQHLIFEAEKYEQPQYLPLAKILRVINFSYLTDLWGDVPYTKAALAYKGVYTPAYDPQETIYPALLDELNSANLTLASPLPAIDPNYDMLFHGDVLKWRKLANSLRLRLLLRCSKKYTHATIILKTMLDDPYTYPIITQNADNAQLPYLGSRAEDSWPFSDLANGYDEFDKRKPSKDLVDRLKALNDPRLPIMVAKVNRKEGAIVDTSDYVGVPNALPDPSKYNGGNDHMSHFSDAFNQPSGNFNKATFITAAEVYFILAEIVQIGKVKVPNENAASLYYKGIAASMDYYGAQEPEDYYEQPSVKYDGTLRQLIHQKWIAQLFVGIEGWMDHRRTGYPQFVLGPLAVQPTIPLRFMYPLEESLYNYEEYNKAKIRMGGDLQDTKMWLIK